MLVAAFLALMLTMMTVSSALAQTGTPPAGTATPVATNTPAATATAAATPAPTRTPAATPRATSTAAPVTGAPKTGGAPLDQGTSMGLMLALAGVGAVVLGSGFWAYRRMLSKK